MTVAPWFAAARPRVTPSQLAEPGEIGAPHVALEEDVRELPLAHDLDEPGRLELLQMMRDGRVTDLLPHDDVPTRHGAVRLRELLQDAIAPRLRERTRDALHLLLGEPRHRAGQLT